MTADNELLRVTCPNPACRAAFQTSAEYRGVKTQCPNCHQDLVIGEEPPTFAPAVLEPVTAPQPVNQPRPRWSTGWLIVAIIAVCVLLVLVMLAVPVVVQVAHKIASKSRQDTTTTAMTEISNTDTALDEFQVDNGRYPTTQEGLQALVTAPAGLTAWKGPYLKNALGNDPWGNPYIYHCPGQHNTDGYDLSSAGPDGQEGTADDITNWITK